MGPSSREKLQNNGKRRTRNGKGEGRGLRGGEDDESLQVSVQGLALQVRILGTFESEGRRQKEG